MTAPEPSADVQPGHDGEVWDCLCRQPDGEHHWTCPARPAAPSEPPAHDRTTCVDPKCADIICSQPPADVQQAQDLADLADDVRLLGKLHRTDTRTGDGQGEEPEDEHDAALDELYGLFIGLHGCKITVGQTREGDRCVVHLNPWPCPEVESDVARSRELAALAARPSADTETLRDALLDVLGAIQGLRGPIRGEHAQQRVIDAADRAQRHLDRTTR